jgi:hypothetical protein
MIILLIGNIEGILASLVVLFYYNGIPQDLSISMPLK